MQNMFLYISLVLLFSSSSWSKKDYFKVINALLSRGDHCKFIESFSGKPFSQIEPLLKDPHKGHKVTAGGIREYLAALSYLEKGFERSYSKGDFIKQGITWDIKTPYFFGPKKYVPKTSHEMAEKIVRHAMTPSEEVFPSFVISGYAEDDIVFEDDEETLVKHILIDLTFTEKDEEDFLRHAVLRHPSFQLVKKNIVFLNYQTELSSKIKPFYNLLKAD